MKKKQIIIAIILLLLLSIASGCRFQSVDEYHGTEKDTEITVGNPIDENNHQTEKETKTIDSNKEGMSEETSKKNEQQSSNVTNKDGKIKSDKTEKLEPEKSNTSTTTPIKKASNTTNASSSSQENKDKNKPIEPSKKYVTISIRCNTILNNYEQLDPALQSERFVPANGVILKNTQFPLEDGENVFDILVKASRKHRIHMQYQGADQNIYGSVYVQAINNIYEFSCGDLSGWMYSVNGTYPNVGVSAYKLKNGDKIQWNYTCDLGRDLGVNWLNK